MAVSEYLVRSEYVGTGSVAEYTFDFKIANLEHLLIVQSTDLLVETFRVRGSDTTYISSVDFDAVEGGGTVTLVSNLPNTHNLAIILANDEPLQASEFKNKADFTLSRFEAALDVLGGAMQRVAYLCNRALKLPEEMLDASVAVFSTEIPIPVASRLLGINSTADAIELIDINAILLDALMTGGMLLFGTVDPVSGDGSNGQYFINTSSMTFFGPKVLGVWPAGQSMGGGVGGLPAGGAADAALTKVSATDGDADWDDLVFLGFSSRFGAWSSAGLRDTLEKILNFIRLAPTISLSMAGGSGTVRERGDDVLASLMSATVTKNADPIAAVRFYRGASLINTVASPNAAGGVETYNETTDITTTTSFTAQVDDNGATGGPSTVISNTVTWTFLYPYYWGNGAPGKTPAQVAALTKVIATPPSALSFTASNDVFYLAYPATSAALTSIKDSLGFETITDWTATTGNITGLDATAQSYRIYEFNNIVTPGTFPYTFS